ncbi:MAG: hypothetical protein ACRDVD_07345 [Acidimicrobiia bacterium]
MLAAGLAMVMVVGLVQLIAYQYTRGALVAALERGVRAGAVTGSGAEECRAALADSLAEVLGGTAGETVTVDCSADPEAVRARAVGMVPAWFAGGPDLAVDVEAMARREPVP